MKWPHKPIGDYLTESCVAASSPSAERRIRVRLNAEGIEKRPLISETEGATRYFKRRAGQFIYGKQNLHKGAFGVVPPELDDFESSSDLPAFDVADDLRPKWLEYFLKQGNFYKSLVSIARGAATKRIQPEALFAVNLPVPTLDVQDQIIQRMDLCASEHSQLEHEIAHQQSLLGKLKQAILQEAIQGKLTADWRAANPHVEPASQLLKRIQAEKARLIAAKKLRIEKPLPKITPEEIPFEIPESWEWCRVGAIGSVKVGATPKREVHALWGGKVSWVSSGEVANNSIWKTRETITEEAVETTSAKVNPAGSVLVAMIGQGKTRGQTAILRIDAATNQNVAAIHLLGSIASEFVWLNFLARYEETRQGASGGNQPALNGMKIRNTLIPLPPLAEQAAIVERVEALMSTCRELETEIEQSRTHAAHLLQAVLKEAFAPSRENSPIRTPRSSNSPDLLGIIKQKGKV